MNKSLFHHNRGAKDRKWSILTVTSIGTFISTLDGGMMSTALPRLTLQFNTDTSAVLWVNVAFWVTSVGLMLTLGWLGDVAGRRRVFILGFVVFSMGLILGSVSNTLWQLVGSRVIQGIGAAMILSNLNALITDGFPRNERGKAFGISGAVVGVGLSAGPLTGGILLDIFDWRVLLYSRVPLGLIGALLSWWVLPVDAMAIRKFRVDILGALALFGTLASFLVFVNRGGKDGFTSTIAILMAITTLVLLPVLVWSERRSVRPIVDIALLKSRQYSTGLIVHTFHYLSHGGVLLVAPFFLIESLGYSPTRMGVVLASFYIGRTIGAPLAGRLSDKFGPLPFIMLGNFLLASGLLWLCLQGIGTSFLTLISAMLISSLGSACLEPVLTNLIMGSTPEDRRGTASAAIATSRQAAFCVGVALVGAIYVIRERLYLDYNSGSAIDIQRLSYEAIAVGFRDSMMFGVVVVVVAGILSLRLMANPRRKCLERD